MTPNPLQNGYAPTWANGWGQDRYGLFTEIKLGTAIQRMRWIPPGTFQMGSPEDEPGRFDREGPRHTVQLTQGFWLADTPCTQELWTEVMGSNPSRFQSPQRPVEKVSWRDCQRFLQAAEERQPGLHWKLPTEAQWEYACRAETKGAIWLGDLEILGSNNAPLLNEIAWYAGNSGVDFDSKEGRDSSGWEEKQFPHKWAGTREVKGKEANPWGLFDMLGNVFEWCADSWGREPYPGDSRVDPIGTGGSLRMVRGGSWYSLASYVRAAFRRGFASGSRRDYLGFRLSRGPGP